MLVVLGMLFVSSNQPIIMVVSMIVLTLCYGIYWYLIFDTFWYSYMMLLVMLSGVLVVFTYMVSLIPNERFEIMTLVYISLVCLFVSVGFGMIMFWIMDDGIKLWEEMLSVVNVFLIVFLLMIMLMVVWITLFNKMPLRI